MAAALFKWEGFNQKTAQKNTSRKWMFYHVLLIEMGHFTYFTKTNGDLSILLCGCLWVGLGDSSSRDGLETLFWDSSGVSGQKIIQNPPEIGMRCDLQSLFICFIIQSVDKIF